MTSRVWRSLLILAPRHPSYLGSAQRHPSIHDSMNQSIHGRRSNDFGPVPVPVPVEHNSAGQWQPRPLSDRSRGKHERRVPCVNADTDASWRAKTHTALIPGINKANQALGMAWHGMDLLLCGMDGQGRQGEQIGEVRDFQTGGKSLAFQSWSSAISQWSACAYGIMGREGKNYELLNEKYGCAFRLESPLGLETGPAWSWTRWLGSGLHGLLGESSEASRLDMT
jgi:hypothetical protein